MTMRSTSSASMPSAEPAARSPRASSPRDTINANLDTNLKDLVDWSKGHLLYMEQLKVIAFTIVLSVVGTAIIAYVLKFTIGLRPTPEQEEAGLDRLRSRRRGLYPLVIRDIEALY